MAQFELTIFHIFDRLNSKAQTRQKLHTFFCCSFPSLACFSPFGWSLPVNPLDWKEKVLWRCSSQNFTKLKFSFRFSSLYFTFFSPNCCTPLAQGNVLGRKLHWLLLPISPVGTSFIHFSLQNNAKWWARAIGRALHRKANPTVGQNALCLGFPRGKVVRRRGHSCENWRNVNHSNGGCSTGFVKNSSRLEKNVK